MVSEPTPKKVHQGRNIKRIREILGVKQEVLAHDLGLSQQAISQLEQKETLDHDMLEKVAKALKVSPEAINKFNEEAAVNFFNTFNDNSISHVIGNYGTYNFNPIDKWMEALEENKKLYERLLQSEREKVEILQKSVKH
jgi:transcriptional regulator with XRE-family HTH domain